MPKDQDKSRFLDIIAVHLFTFLKIIIFLLLLLTIFFIFIEIYTEHGIVVLPFEIENENFSGISIADQITSELLWIQQIHDKKNNAKILLNSKIIFEAGLSADMSPSYSLVPKTEIMEYSMAETGTISTGYGSLDPGKIIIAFKNVCPARKPDAIIRGSLQRYGSNVILVAVLEGENVKSWMVRQTIEKNNEEQFHEMICNLTFKIAHDLPQSNVSAKTWEGLKYYTEALDAYNQYELTGNIDAIDLAGNYSLKAIESEKKYRNPYDLLRTVAFEYVRLDKQNIALEICNETIELYPSSEYGWENKANILHILNMTNEAISAYDNATELNPQYAEAWNDKGSAHSDLKNYPEAIKAFDEATRIDPNYAYAWYNKGLAQKDQGNYGEAISAFNEVIQINPKCAYAWYSKGKALKAQGNLDEAIRAYSKATEINSQYADAWYDKGLALKAQGKYDEAIRAFDRAIWINPKDVDALNQKGLALSAQGKYNESIQEYTEATEINSQYADAWYNKGKALKYQGKYDEAIRAFDKAIGINPKDVDALNQKDLALNLREML